MRTRENIEQKTNAFPHQHFKQPSVISCQVKENKLTVQLDDGREVGIIIDLLNK